MQYRTATGCMSTIAAMGRKGMLGSIGITEEDFTKVSSDTPWLGSDRNRVEQAFKCLLYGTIDACGIPRFQLPAEYIAAGISIFVSPVNIHVACRFLERIPTAEQLGRGADDSDPITCRQLFAIVSQLVGDPINSASVKMFEKNTGLKIEREILKLKHNEKKGDNNEPT